MTSSPDLREQLAVNAEIADRSTDWPEKSWQILREIGALRWSIPPAYGGAGCAPVDVLRGMEDISAGCLTTAFALSQREAAVRHLLKGPSHLRDRYLPGLAAGDTFLTVGLSQLTTSRQHQGPALRATPLSSGGYRLDGEIPWVTGADKATAIVAGATLPDNAQILVLLTSDNLAGMIEPPLQLAALVGSRTSLVRCNGANVPAEAVLAGPEEKVLGRVGGGGLETSCLAIGLAAAASHFIQQEVAQRPDLSPIAERFDSALHNARDRLHELAILAHDPNQTLALRLDCTRLALRTTQAALMVAKGIGFVEPHPAQRWARQAMFFLVWSCPRPVAEGVLADLAAF